jgi:hypothetical protein
MSPNFEMALFTAQLTGSAILTDSETRRDEFIHAQTVNAGETVHPMKSLTDIINENKFILSADPNINFKKAVYSDFGTLRTLFREILVEVKKETTEISTSMIARYKSDFGRAIRNAENAYSPQGGNIFKARLKFLIPQGGISHKNVQRLLIKSGSSGYLSNVPIVIFLEPAEW